MTFDDVAGEMTQNPEIARSKMFGMACLKLPNGKVFAAEFHEDMTFKLGTEAITKDGLDEFEPMPGRKMKGWAIVAADQSDRWLELAQQAHDFTLEATK